MFSHTVSLSGVFSLRTYMRMFEVLLPASQSYATVTCSRIGFLIVQGRQIRDGKMSMAVMQQRITQTRLTMLWRSICVRQRLSQPLSKRTLHLHPLLGLHWLSGKSSSQGASRRSRKSSVREWRPTSRKRLSEPVPANLSWRKLLPVPPLHQLDSIHV